MSPTAFPPGRREFESACQRWALVPDGAPFSTPSSVLAPVRRADGTPAMLKRALVAEEQRGNAVMVWWNDVGAGSGGAAAVLEHDETTILIERAMGARSVAAMAESGAGCGGADGADEGSGDDAATRILCQAVARLHTVPGPVPPTLANALPTLTDWFADLFGHAEQRGGLFARAAADARVLLADQRGSVVLHGDLHHGNVLDFGDAGWLAIDPKGIVGDPIFDYLNLLCNPTPAVAVRPGRLARQVAVVADASGHDSELLLRWLRAWCALSATWFELDGLSADHVLVVGAEAERLLDGRS